MHAIVSTDSQNETHWMNFSWSLGFDLGAFEPISPCLLEIPNCVTFIENGISEENVSSEINCSLICFWSCKDDHWR